MKPFPKVTAAGGLIDVLALPADEITIETIAHRLAQQNRWTGTFRHPLSVATHSILVSFLAPKRWAYEGLLHDATEAWVGDLPSPFKGICPAYCTIEASVRLQLAAVFGLEPEEPFQVHAADKRAVHLECVALTGRWYGGDVVFSPAEERLMHELLSRELGWRESRDMFLSRYEQVKGLRRAQTRRDWPSPPAPSGHR